MDYKPYEPASTDDLVEYLDKNVAEAIDTLRNTTDEQFMDTGVLHEPPKKVEPVKPPEPQE